MDHAPINQQKMVSDTFFPEGEENGDIRDGNNYPVEHDRLRGEGQVLNLDIGGRSLGAMQLAV
jgi:hypothetical protein